MSHGRVESQTAVPARSGELLLAAFLSTVTMLFAGFTAAYLIRRTGPDWERIRLPDSVWGNAVILVTASVALEVARRSARRAWLWAGALLGLAFLAGQVLTWVELARSGVLLPTHPHSAFFYMLSAVHGLHLVGGIAWVIGAAAREAGSRLVAVYWHFLAVLWVYVLVLLRVG